MTINILELTLSAYTSIKQPSRKAGRFWSAESQVRRILRHIGKGARWYNKAIDINPFQTM